MANKSVHNCQKYCISTGFRNFMTNVHIVRLLIIFIIIINKGRSQDIQLLEEYPPYRIVVFCSKINQDFELKFVASNALGQVMFVENVISPYKILFFRVGEKCTSTITARIIDHPNGVVTFNFLKSSFGSSISIVSQDGLVKDWDSLPQGLWPSNASDNTGYFMMAECDSWEFFPTDEKGIHQWLDRAYVSQLINQNKIHVKQNPARQPIQAGPRSVLQRAKGDQ